MIVCPVCEHPQQQGTECEVCGKRLVKGPAASDLALPRVEGLEPTSHAPIDTAAERLVDLEPTRHAAAGPAGGVSLEIEATRAAPVDVDVALAPDIEPTASGLPDDGPTVLPALLPCRYCRTPAAPGERICSRCGMRLPVLAAAAPEPVAATRICSCGLAVHGGVCPSCGARMA